MPLTPLEIHNKEFDTRMRGYDQDEVNEFLDQVIRDYEILIRQKKELEDKLEIAEKKLSNYGEMQDSLNKSIIVAQDAADRLKENTEKEMEVIKRESESYAENVQKEANDYATKIRRQADDYATEVHKEADDNADELLQEAVAKARKIEDETEALRKQSRVFRQRLQLLIESQLELLTKEDWDNLLVGKPMEFPNTETIIEVEKELEEKIEDQLEHAEQIDELAADVDTGETEEVAETVGTEESFGDVEEVRMDAEVAEEAEEDIVAEYPEELDSEVDSDYEENSDVDSVAFEEDEHYNNESQNGEYEEGSMPAVELPDSE